MEFLDIFWAKEVAENMKHIIKKRQRVSSFTLETRDSARSASSITHKHTYKQHIKIHI